MTTTTTTTTATISRVRPRTVVFWVVTAFLLGTLLGSNKFVQQQQQLQVPLSTAKAIATPATTHDAATAIRDSVPINNIIKPIDKESNNKKLILVTGVAGYIGSHTALLLLEQGYRVLGVDNMSRGSWQAVHTLQDLNNNNDNDSFTFAQLDLQNEVQVNDLFRQHPVHAVLHVAAYAFVVESIQYPALYQQNNRESTRVLVRVMQRNDVHQLVFASSCAVYGSSTQNVLTEDMPAHPLNPYGQSKWDSERDLREMLQQSSSSSSSSSRMQIRMLRYFNVVGADAQGRLGERPRPSLAIYGRLWTAITAVVHGTQPCVHAAPGARDYIHVEDVARANLAALQHLQESVDDHRNDAKINKMNKDDANIIVWNVATQQPTTTQEFVEAARQITGHEIPLCPNLLKTDDDIANATLLASSRASFVLGSHQALTDNTGWQPRYTDLKAMLTTAYKFQQQQPLPLQSEVAIVMYDTRSLEDVEDVHQDYVYWRWTAELNFHYARRHGYDFIYWHAQAPKDYQDHVEDWNLDSDGVNSELKTRPSCFLTLSNGTKVGRGASWCKLLAITSVLQQGYTTAVFMDSDAFLQPDAPDIYSILARTPATNQQRPLLWLPRNSAFSAQRKLQKDHPNAGLHFWVNMTHHSMPDIWRLLKQWWQLDMTAQKNMYEQTSMWSILEANWARAPTPRQLHNCGVGLLDDTFMEVNNTDQYPIVHINSLEKHLRSQIIYPKFLQVYNESSRHKVVDQVRPFSVAQAQRMQRLLEDPVDNQKCATKQLPIKELW